MRPRINPMDRAVTLALEHYVDLAGSGCLTDDAPDLIRTCVGSYLARTSTTHRSPAMSRRIYVLLSRLRETHDAAHNSRRIEARKCG